MNWISTFNAQAAWNGKRLAGQRPIKYTEPEYCTNTEGAHHPRSDYGDYPKPGKLDILNNITNQEYTNLIFVANSVDKRFLQTNYMPNFAENLGSNLVGVAQLIYNIEINLLSQI